MARSMVRLRLNPEAFFPDGLAQPSQRCARKDLAVGQRCQWGAHRGMLRGQFFFRNLTFATRKGVELINLTGRNTA